ncbi:MAG TPA: toxin glutamine deamidase domain-containing protein [Mycobacteriales bacterium]|nr:toxin glutamine deamidase domain-containing protein [Mycobacteriales bacterium]
MATREFPALGFDPAPGDAGAVSAAAADVSGAGKVFGDASANVSRLNSSGWTGDAADAFRGQLKDLPRDLDLAARSHRTAAQTLSDWSTGLTARQRRAQELEVRAAELRRWEQAAVAEVNRLAGRTAPSGSPEFARLKDQYDSARSTATTLGSDLQEVLAQARRLRDEHRSAASTAAGRIRDVADAPYKEPGWLSRAWSSVKGWIADHADALAKISSVLKGISAVLGVLSLVPGLQFLAPFALLTAGAALAIDVALKVATGKGSWASIGIDAALTFLPGGKILSGLKGVKAAVAGERGLVAGERALASGEKLLAGGEDVAGAVSKLAKGNPAKGLGSTLVHEGTAGNSVVKRFFPELSGTNPLFRLTKATDGAHPRVGGWGFQNNCQSCVTAVDKQLAGLTKDTRAIERVTGDAMSSPAWKQNIANATGTTNTFTSVGSYDDIARELHNAGDGARGIIHGMRTGPGGMPVAGHVFNVVNRNGRIFFLDGQTGKLARLENYTGGLELLRTK